MGPIQHQSSLMHPAVSHRGEEGRGPSLQSAGANAGDRWGAQCGGCKEGSVGGTRQSSSRVTQRESPRTSRQSRHAAGNYGLAMGHPVHCGPPPRLATRFRETGAGSKVRSNRLAASAASSAGSPDTLMCL